MKRSGRLKHNNAPRPATLRDRLASQESVSAPVKKKPIVRPSSPPLKMRPRKRPEKPHLSADALKGAMVSAIMEADESKYAEMGRLGRWAIKLRQSWLVVGLEAAGLIGLVFAVGLFVYEMRERQSQRVAQSWEAIATVLPGRSGKKEALEFLNAEYFCFEEPDLVYRIRKTLLRDDSFPYVPFEEIPIDYNDPVEETSARYHYNERRNWHWCWKERADLSSLRLGINIHGGAVDLRGINLEGANLSYGDFSGALLSDANLKGTTFFLSDLSGAKLHDVDIENAFFFGTDLSNAHVNGTLTGSRIYASNLDSATIGDFFKFDEFTIKNSSVNNTEFKMFWAIAKTSTGIDTLYDPNPNELCDYIDVFAWAFEESPPIFHCPKKSIWLYSKQAKGMDMYIDRRTPDQIQMELFSLNGTIDPDAMTPDHNGPGLPTHIDTLITNADALEEIWSNSEQRSQDRLLPTDTNLDEN